MKEVSYNELFNNTQIDLSVFFEDDFTFPRSFELSAILYRVVHMNVPLVLEPMIERLNQIDPSFAESLQAFVIEFQKWDDLIEDWKQVIRDDIDSALSIIGQKNESAYNLLQEKIGLISVTEPEEVYSVLHHYGAFCVIPPVYSPIFDEFICCKRVWEPFCIYSDYSADVSDDLQRKVS